ncbi:MAG: hypothetical protein KGL39_12620 [Patescibacteria group bacterium]|nr:hypothetical protein [Patescibacteria group bacterium]
MARDYFVNGESLVYVKSANFGGGALTQLGLSEGPIRIRPNFRHRAIKVDAWGPGSPAEIQTMLFDVNIQMTLVHFDRSVLDSCLTESLGGGTLLGGDNVWRLNRAGVRLGNAAASQTTNNHFIGLYITGPTSSPSKPWHFWFSYLTGPPMDFPLGTERSAVGLNWRAIPYPTTGTAGDPAGAITSNVPGGATNQVVWTHSLSD